MAGLDCCPALPHADTCAESSQPGSKEPLEPMGFPQPGLAVELAFMPCPRSAFSRLFKQPVLSWGDHHPPLLLLSLCTEARWPAKGSGPHQPQGRPEEARPVSPPTSAPVSAHAAWVPLPNPLTPAALTPQPHTHPRVPLPGDLSSQALLSLRGPSLAMRRARCLPQ